MPEVLRAAVIGLGVGERHIRGYESEPRCEVAAICDRDEHKLKSVGARHPGIAQYLNADDVLDDPTIDIVSIASYDNYHASQVLKAIAMGKHVFVEKPFCLTSKEYAEIDTELANNPQLHFSSNLVLRRAPQFLDLKARLENNKLGEIYYMEADYNYGRLQKIIEGWRGEIPFYSVSHGGAIHMIDLIIWLSGKTPARVVAAGNSTATRGTPFRYPSQVTALLEFPDGTTAKVSANFPSVCPHHHGLQVFGSEGTFIHTHEGGVYYNSRDPEAVAEKVHLPYLRDEKGAVQKTFIAQILDGLKEDVTRQDVFRSMAVSLAVEKSLESGNWEKIEYGKSANIES